MIVSSNIRRGPVLAIILASYTMIVLDISIVIAALPKIHDTLGFSATALSGRHDPRLGRPLLVPDAAPVGSPCSLKRVWEPAILLGARSL